MHAVDRLVSPNEVMKKRPREWDSTRPQKIKILFYSLTRIHGERKTFSMNDEEIDDD